MNTKTQELLDRTFNFGVTILVLLAKSKYDDILSIPRKQLARASASIGANYEEAQAAESKKDFIHKIGIVCKECRECNYWIRILKAICDKQGIQSDLEKLQTESIELKSIFTSIKLSAEGKPISL